jgi:hypothetical protein
LKNCRDPEKRKYLKISKNPGNLQLKALENSKCCRKSPGNLKIAGKETRGKNLSISGESAGKSCKS